jgi:hypothetical protein
MLKSTSKYYYTKLDKNCQGIYDSILSAWEAYNPNPSFKMGSADNNSLQRVMDYVRYDNPGLFFIDYGGGISLSGSMFGVTLQSKFLYKEKQIDDMEKQLGSIVAGLVASSKFNAMDKYQKILALHDYLVKNVTYTVGGDINETTSVVGALITRRAVCEGYAKAFKMLCDQAGLSCILVTGKATPLLRPEEYHAWNIVKLDGICSHVDVTWDSTTRGNSETNYNHVCLDDDDMAKDHVWDRSILPACTSSQHNYYVKNGQCVNNSAEFKSYVASQAKQGKKEIALKLTIGKETTNDKIMNLTREALRGINNSPMGLRYNPTRGTVTINLK